MNVSKIAQVQALYQLVGKNTSPKRPQPLAIDNNAVSISISKEAKALADAAQQADIEKDLSK